MVILAFEIQKIPRVGWKTISGWNHVKTHFSHDIMDVAELRRRKRGNPSPFQTVTLFHFSLHQISSVQKKNDTSPFRPKHFHPDPPFIQRCPWLFGSFFSQELGGGRPCIPAPAASWQSSTDSMARYWSGHTLLPGTCGFFFSFGTFKHGEWKIAPLNGKKTWGKTWGHGKKNIRKKPMGQHKFPTIHLAIYPSNPTSWCKFVQLLSALAEANPRVIRRLSTAIQRHLAGRSADRTLLTCRKKRPQSDVAKWHEPWGILVG